MGMRPAVSAVAWPIVCTVTYYASSHRKDSLSCHYKQGRLLDVKHDARCVTGKVGERRKPEEGRILIYYYINIT